MARVPALPIISFRPPFAALLAFRLLALSLLLPKYRMLVVPTKAKIAALHARLRMAQFCIRSYSECDSGVKGRVFGNGLTLDGSHD